MSQREIKFRIWDDNASRMIDHAELNRSLCSLTLPDGTKRMIPMITFAMTVPQGPYLLEQYTGLKDKNGIEIYEGDVLQHTTKVEHGDSSLCIGAIGWNAEWCLYEIGDSWITDGDIHPKTFLVVGNVHQNAEMLTC